MSRRRKSSTTLPSCATLNGPLRSITVRSGEVHVHLVSTNDVTVFEQTGTMADNTVERDLVIEIS